MRSLETRTTVVAGPLALHTRRLLAARRGTLGMQIMTMEQLAAHLAGGLLRPASSEELDIAVRAALDGGGYGDLQELATFPGAVRAALQTLGRLWESHLSLAEASRLSPRMADLALLEARTREALPCGSLAPPDLAWAAAQRAHLAGRLSGPVEFACLPYVAPVWRGLLDALATHVPVRWSGPAPLGGAGLPGQRTTEEGARALPHPDVVACADPRSEALEALRWVRGLLASGEAGPGDIAVAAADPRAWDEAVLAGRAHCGLPLHFSHGVPALETRPGQACAALADLLQHGPSQERVRRVLAHSAAGAPALAQLPSNALLGIAPHAALTEPEHWRAALAAALPARPDGLDPAPMLLHLLEATGQGLSGAPESGRLFLPPAAHRLWTDALRRAPCNALPIALEALRSADARHPGDSVTWGPAGHLAASPRPFVWLLGLNARAWPRQANDDPLLPAHVMDPSRLGLPTAAALDRAAFAAIRDGATGALTLSRARRTPHGSILAPSPLLPASNTERILRRHRIPPHACNPADRLLARPAEAAVHETTMAATACAGGRRSRLANSHDGLLPASHALVAGTLDRVQSPTSLRLLLRDPQGFVWRHALRWSSPPRAAGQLTLDPRAHGELVAYSDANQPAIPIHSSR